MKTLPRLIESAECCSTERARKHSNDNAVLDLGRSGNRILHPKPDVEFPHSLGSEAAVEISTQLATAAIRASAAQSGTVNRPDADVWRPDAGWPLCAA